MHLLPLLLATASLAAEGASPWAPVGRLHLLAVHLPIAIVLVTGLLEGWSRLVRRPAPREAVRFLLVVGAVSAVVTVGLGFALASGEEFHGRAARTLELHRWVGVAAAALAVAAAVLHHLGSTRKERALVVAYGLALLLAAVGVGAGGHLGATLVHGEGYLLGDAPGDDDDDGDRIAPSDGDDATGPAEDRTRHADDPRLLALQGPVDYARDVKPVFERSCLKCHGPEKRKGRLRLDHARFALKGGESGDALVPGDSSRSLIVKLITLPVDDDDVMPEKGKLLSDVEIAVITRWIDEGAKWEE